MDRSSSSSTSTSISLSAMASPRATEPNTEAWDTPSRPHSLSWVRRVCSTSLRAAGIINESSKPECHRIAACSAAPASIQLLLKPHGAQAQNRDPVYRQGCHLRPQDVHPRAFQEDAARSSEERRVGKECRS